MLFWSRISFLLVPLKVRRTEMINTLVVKWQCHEIFWYFFHLPSSQAVVHPGFISAFPGLPYVNCNLSRGELYVHRG